MRPLIYLHGFNSTPASAKAQATLRWMAQHCPHVRVHIPPLPVTPAATVDAIDELLHDVCDDLPYIKKPPLGETSAQPCAPVFMGSSMGGFYANHFAQKYGGKAVLINPAVYPHRLLTAFLGPQINPHTGETYTLRKQHMIELQALIVDPMTRPQQRMVLLQTGDETLDYREAADYYAASICHVEQGGDHSFCHFEKWLPAIAQFLEIDSHE
ncbi:esterase [Pseudomonadales bacterium]|nr:esterase [Pseudomonadales bacterium]